MSNIITVSNKTKEGLPITGKSSLHIQVPTAPVLPSAPTAPALPTMPTAPVLPSAPKAVSTVYNPNVTNNNTISNKIDSKAEITRLVFAAAAGNDKANKSLAEWNKDNDSFFINKLVKSQSKEFEKKHPIRSLINAIGYVIPATIEGVAATTANDIQYTMSDATSTEKVVRAVNTFNDDMDLLANPIKGAIIEKSKGKSLIKGFEKGLLGEEAYLYDTGNWMSDMALELISDPNVLGDLIRVAGKTIASKVLGKAMGNAGVATIERALREGVTNMSQEEIELILREARKELVDSNQMTAMLAKRSDDLDNIISSQADGIINITKRYSDNIPSKESVIKDLRNVLDNTHAGTFNVYKTANAIGAISDATDSLILRSGIAGMTGGYSVLPYELRQGIKSTVQRKFFKLGSTVFKRATLPMEEIAQGFTKDGIIDLQKTKSAAIRKGLEDPMSKTNIYAVSDVMNQIAEQAIKDPNGHIFTNMQELVAKEGKQGTFNYMQDIFGSKIAVTFVESKEGVKAIPIKIFNLSSIDDALAAGAYIISKPDYTLVAKAIASKHMDNLATAAYKSWINKFKYWALFSYATAIRNLNDILTKTALSLGSLKDTLLYGYEGIKTIEEFERTTGILLDSISGNKKLIEAAFDEAGEPSLDNLIDTIINDKYIKELIPGNANSKLGNFIPLEELKDMKFFKSETYDELVTRIRTWSDFMVAGVGIETDTGSKIADMLNKSRNIDKSLYGTDLDGLGSVYSIKETFLNDPTYSKHVRDNIINTYNLKNTDDINAKELIQRYGSPIDISGTLHKSVFNIPEINYGLKNGFSQAYVNAVSENPSLYKINKMHFTEDLLNGAIDTDPVTTELAILYDELMHIDTAVSLSIGDAMRLYEISGEHLDNTELFNILQNKSETFKMLSDEDKELILKRLNTDRHLTEQVNEAIEQVKEILDLIEGQTKYTAYAPINKTLEDYADLLNIKTQLENLITDKEDLIKYLKENIYTKDNTAITTSMDLTTLSIPFNDPRLVHSNEIVTVNKALRDRADAKALSELDELSRSRYIDEFLDKKFPGTNPNDLQIVKDYFKREIQLKNYSRSIYQVMIDIKSRFPELFEDINKVPIYKVEHPEFFKAFNNIESKLRDPNYILTTEEMNTITDVIKLVDKYNKENTYTNIATMYKVKDPVQSMITKVLSEYKGIQTISEEYSKIFTIKKLYQNTFSEYYSAQPLAKKYFDTLKQRKYINEAYPNLVSDNNIINEQSKYYQNLWDSKVKIEEVYSDLIAEYKQATNINDPSSLQSLIDKIQSQINTMYSFTSSNSELKNNLYMHLKDIELERNTARQVVSDYYSDDNPTKAWLNDQDELKSFTYYEPDVNMDIIEFEEGHVFTKKERQDLIQKLEDNKQYLQKEYLKPGPTSPYGKPIYNYDSGKGKPQLIGWTKYKSAFKRHIKDLNTQIKALKSGVQTIDSITWIKSFEKIKPSERTAANADLIYNRLSNSFDTSRFRNANYNQKKKIERNVEAYLKRDLSKYYPTVERTSNKAGSLQNRPVQVKKTAKRIVNDTDNVTKLVPLTAETDDYLNPVEYILDEMANGTQTTHHMKWKKEHDRAFKDLTLDYEIPEYNVLDFDFSKSLEETLPNSIDTIKQDINNLKRLISNKQKIKLDVIDLDNTISDLYDLYTNYLKQYIVDEQVRKDVFSNYKNHIFSNKLVQDITNLKDAKHLSVQDLDQAIDNFQANIDGYISNIKQSLTGPTNMKALDLVDNIEFYANEIAGDLRSTYLNLTFKSLDTPSYDDILQDIISLQKNNRTKVLGLNSEKNIKRYFSDIGVDYTRTKRLNAIVDFKERLLSNKIYKGGAKDFKQYQKTGIVPDKLISEVEKFAKDYDAHIGDMINIAELSDLQETAQRKANKYFNLSVDFNNQLGYLFNPEDKRHIFEGVPEGKTVLEALEDSFANDFFELPDIDALELLGKDSTLNLAYLNYYKKVRANYYAEGRRLRTIRDAANAKYEVYRQIYNQIRTGKVLDELEEPALWRLMDHRGRRLTPILREDSEEPFAYVEGANTLKELIDASNKLNTPHDLDIDIPHVYSPEMLTQDDFLAMQFNDYLTKIESNPEYRESYLAVMNDVFKSKEAQNFNDLCVNFIQHEQISREYRALQPQLKVMRDSLAIEKENLRRAMAYNVWNPKRIINQKLNDYNAFKEVRDIVKEDYHIAILNPLYEANKALEEFKYYPEVKVTTDEELRQLIIQLDIMDNNIDLKNLSNEKNLRYNLMLEDINRYNIQDNKFNLDTELLNTFITKRDALNKRLGKDIHEHSNDFDYIYKQLNQDVHTIKNQNVDGLDWELKDYAEYKKLRKQIKEQLDFLFDWSKLRRDNIYSLTQQTVEDMTTGLYSFKSLSDYLDQDTINMLVAANGGKPLDLDNIYSIRNIYNFLFKQDEFLDTTGIPFLIADENNKQLVRELAKEDIVAHLNSFIETGDLRTLYANKDAASIYKELSKSIDFNAEQALYESAMGITDASYINSIYTIAERHAVDKSIPQYQFKKIWNNFIEEVKTKYTTEAVYPERILDFLDEQAEGNRFFGLARVNPKAAESLEHVIDLAKDKLNKLDNTSFAKKAKELYTKYNPLAYFGEFERFGRTGQYIGLMNLGYKKYQALTEVINTHFDYSMKSNFVGKLELLIPFVTFPIENLKYWAKQIDTNPVYVLSMLRLREANYRMRERNDFELEKNKGLMYNYNVGNLVLGNIEPGKANTVLKLNPSMYDALGILQNPLGSALEKSILPIELTNTSPGKYDNVWPGQNKETQFNLPISKNHALTFKPKDIVNSIPFVGSMGTRVSNVVNKVKEHGVSLSSVMPTMFGYMSNYARPENNYRKYTPRKYNKTLRNYTKRYYPRVYYRPSANPFIRPVAKHYRPTAYAYKYRNNNLVTQHKYKSIYGRGY